MNGSQRRDTKPMPPPTHSQQQKDNGTYASKPNGPAAFQVSTRQVKKLEQNAFPSYDPKCVDDPDDILVESFDKDDEALSLLSEQSGVLDDTSMDSEDDLLQTNLGDDFLR